MHSILTFPSPQVFTRKKSLLPKRLLLLSITNALLQMRQSNVNRVLLRRVSLDTTGVFRCEVTSKKSPGFDAKFQEARLDVLGVYYLE